MLAEAEARQQQHELTLRRLELEAGCVPVPAPRPTPTFRVECRILSRTFPCLSPKIGLHIPRFFPFAKTVCVSVRKNSIDESTDKK